MNSKNIVFVINEFNNHGGAQRVASVLAEDFISDGHKVSILSINEQKNVPSYFSSEISVKVLHSDGYRAPNPIEISSNLKSFKIRKVQKEVKRRHLLKKKREEVLHYFDQFGDEEVFVIVIQVYGMQWLQPLLYRPNIKIIGQSHESVEAAQSSKRFKRILRYYRQVSKFLLLTEKDRQFFENIGFLNTAVMHNPTPFRSYTKPEVLFANKRIVSSGRLIDDKGFDVLIEAFSKVASDLTGWTLHIYGDGPAKDHLLNLVDVWDMNDRVFLEGQTKDILTELKKSSLFVLSSKAEGLPMSLIEAQSCGLPCISTDCAPGIREIVEEYKNGLLAPVGDVHVIARHINRLATQPELFVQYSENAFENSKKFDNHVIKEKWYEIFAELGGDSHVQ